MPSSQGPASAAKLLKNCAANNRPPIIACLLMSGRPQIGCSNFTCPGILAPSEIAPPVSRPGLDAGAKFATRTYCHDVEMRHCEERSDEAIQSFLVLLDCFASLEDESAPCGDGNDL